MVYDDEFYGTAAPKRDRGLLWLLIAITTAVAMILLNVVGAIEIVQYAWPIVLAWVGVAMLIRRSEAIEDERIGLWPPIALVATSVTALIGNNPYAVDVLPGIIAGLLAVSCYVLPLVPVIVGIVARRIMPEGAAVLIVVGATVMFYHLRYPFFCWQ